MTDEQNVIAEQAFTHLGEGLQMLMLPAMSTVPGIREVRQAVVDAQNAINRLDDRQAPAR